MKRIAFSALAGLAATGLLALVFGRPGQHWYDLVFLGPLVLSAVVSGNAHQGNEFVFWSGLVTELAIVAFALSWILPRKRGSEGS
jgi:hypothetical protein